MSHTPFDCFWQTLRACLTNMACAPFFLLAVFFYAFYYCWPYQAQLPEHLNAVIADEDQSRLSRAIALDIMASPSFRIVGNLANRSEAISQMKEGLISSIITIPPGFERDALSGVPTSLTLVTNGAFLVVARSQTAGLSGILQEIATKAIMLQAFKAGASLPELAMETLKTAPVLVTRAMYNTISGYLSFAVAIVFVIIFQSIMLCGITMLLNDWFCADPLPAPLLNSFGSPIFMFSLAAPVMCICMFWIIFVEGFAFALHGINSFQNIGATLVTGLFFAWAVSSLGVLLGMLFKKSRFAIYLIIPSSLPCVFISGNLYPWQNIPVYLRFLAWMFPSTPGSECMLRASQAGADILQIFPYLMHMLALGILYFTLACVLTMPLKKAA